MAQIQTWLVNQFEQLDFYDLDNMEQIDVWPFFTPRDNYPDYKSTEDVSEILSSVLEICGSSTTCHRLVRGTEFNLSDHTAVLCFLLPDFAFPSAYSHKSWLARSDLLGCHAMTPERYGVALQQVIYYLLQLPKDTLLGILNPSESKEDILDTLPMRLIRAVLPVFLDHSPWTTHLYFLVMLTSSVLRRFSIGDKAHVYIGRSIASYTREVSILLATVIPKCPMILTNPHPTPLSKSDRYLRSFLSSRTQPPQITFKLSGRLKKLVSVGRSK